MASSTFTKQVRHALNLGGIVRASDPLIFKKRLYHEPNGIALSKGYQWSTLIPGGTVKLFVVIKNVKFLVKMIKKFVFFLHSDAMVELS